MENGKPLEDRGPANEAIIKLEETLNVIPLTWRVFKSGSQGFNGYGLISVGGKIYNVSINLIEKGSKPIGKY